MSDASGVARSPFGEDEQRLVEQIRSYLGRYDTTLDEHDPAFLTPGSLLAAVRRALAAGAEPVPATDVVAALRLVPAARKKLDDTERQLVEAALDRGVTWEQLAAALGGRTPQSVQQRYRRRLGGERSWRTRRPEHRHG
ncbi:SANT/Myb-like DNA-binding domain-containing protein [Saccharopolyspora rosea]|uniref:SANT/Myb-like DNA-binding domain-containing protein n=1 Tax=Saccharopolyspora rosea TaxID=524884 RepID=A0ABW3FUV3_9PSEU|nr:SANT/Myb-like DNA-binding domain-containing protein [Saccharopolyspora rosea]